MGGAFVAVSDDANAPSCNPAGMPYVDSPEMAFMYARLYTGLKLHAGWEETFLGLNYFSCVLPIKKIIALGIDWRNFVSTDLYQEDTISLSFGKNLKDMFPRLIPDISLGLSAKYLKHEFTLDERTKTSEVFKEGSAKDTFTFDVGILVKSGAARDKGLSFGLFHRNVTHPDVGLATNDPVPMETRLGFAYKAKGYYIGKLEVRDIICAVEGSYRAQDWGDTVDKINFHLGWEAWFLKGLIGLRAGGNMNEVTVGASLDKSFAKHFGLRIDYAFIWPLEIQETSGSHRVSLAARF